MHDLAPLRREQDTRAICQGPARGGMEPDGAESRQARGYGQEGTLMSQQPAPGASAPPEVIYIIRHGEKPADPPPAGQGQTPPPAPPFGIDYQGNQDAHSLLPRGWQRCRRARRPVRPGPRRAAGGAASPYGFAVAVLRRPGQDDRAPDIPDDPGSQRPPRASDRVRLRRGPGTPAGRQRGQRLFRRGADLLGA